MKHFEKFTRSGISFEGREHSCPFTFAVGQATLALVGLEERRNCRPGTGP